MNFGYHIKKLRESKSLLQRQLASVLEIDTPMFSKIERGERKAKRSQVVKLAEILDVDEHELLTLWLSDQVLEIVKGEEFADKVLNESLKNLKSLKEVNNVY